MLTHMKRFCIEDTRGNAEAVFVPLCDSLSAL
jgi:hypothetical protein